MYVMYILYLVWSLEVEGIATLSVDLCDTNVRAEDAALWWPYLPSSKRTFNHFILFFSSCFDLSTVFQMRGKKYVLCTQDIWREKWRTSMLMGLRSISNCHAKCGVHLIDLVLINLLFRGKHECLGRQLL